jgi:hypothetical protein
LAAPADAREHVGQRSAIPAREPSVARACAPPSGSRAELARQPRGACLRLNPPGRSFHSGPTTPVRSRTLSRRVLRELQRNESSETRRVSLRTERTSAPVTRSPTQSRTVFSVQADNRGGDQVAFGRRRPRSQAARSHFGVAADNWGGNQVGFWASGREPNQKVKFVGPGRVPRPGPNRRKGAGKCVTALEDCHTSTGL